MTKTIYLVASESGGKPYMFISDTNMETQPEWVVLGAKEITFDVPPAEIVSKKIIAGLEAQKIQMQATATAAINEVEGQIQSLLALENQGEEA